MLQIPLRRIRRCAAAPYPHTDGLRLQGGSIGSWIGQRIRTFVGAAGASEPNTATPLCVPTYTRPFAIIGVMNLLPVPNVHDPDCWRPGRVVELGGEVGRVVGVQHSGIRVLGRPQDAVVVPDAEILGVVPGYVNDRTLRDEDVVATRALVIGKALRLSPDAP